MNKEEFVNELKKINIEITGEQLIKLDKYYNLLIEYNKIMNLTGITEYEGVYLKHFFDSLSLNKIIDLNKINTLCDIGSGAGFPGLVLAIVYPNIKIKLVDSLNKRIEFLKIVIKELNLKNVEAIHDRIEEYSVKNINKYDIVVSRAVAKINMLLEISIQMVKVNGYFVALKSNVSEELKDANNAISILNCKLDKVIEFKLPKENSLRTLVSIKKNSGTPVKYPRKFDKIKKNPL